MKINYFIQFCYFFKGDNDVRDIGIIGRTAGLYNSTSTNNLAFLDFYETNVQLKISVSASAERLKLSMEWSGNQSQRLEDCFQLGKKIAIYL